MVSPESITNATHETIDSLLILAKAQYERAKEARQRHGNRSTLYAINDATNQLNLTLKKKQELEISDWYNLPINRVTPIIAKKKLVI